MLSTQQSAVEQPRSFAKNFGLVLLFTFVAVVSYTSGQKYGGPGPASTNLKASAQPVTSLSTQLSCRWIGASAGNDAWCDSNCNHVPAFCPATSCDCSAAFVHPPGPISPYHTNIESIVNNGYFLNHPPQVQEEIMDQRTKAQKQQKKDNKVANLKDSADKRAGKIAAGKADKGEKVKADRVKVQNPPIVVTPPPIVNEGPTLLNCHWIGASAGTDEWCNQNCNHVPSYCPSTSCQC